jgi:hypothetical protein
MRRWNRVVSNRRELRLKGWMQRTRARLRQNLARPNQLELPSANGMPFLWDASGGRSPTGRPPTREGAPLDGRDRGAPAAGIRSQAAAAVVRLDTASITALADVVAARPIGRDVRLTDLMTADEVAREYRVNREWVYAHKRELGAQPLGSGRKPRLRFRRARVEAFLAYDATRVDRTTPVTPNAAPRTSRSPPRKPVRLLPVRRTPR